MADITGDQLLFVHDWTGNLATDEDITARYERQGQDLYQTVVMTLRQKIALITDDPAQVNIPNQIGYDYSSTLKALQDLLKDFIANGAALIAGMEGGLTPQVATLYRPQSR